MTLNSFLQNGAGCCLIWIGGVMAMNGDLTVGALITFQLYFNSIQTNYRTLQVNQSIFSRIWRLRRPYLVYIRTTNSVFGLNRDPGALVHVSPTT